MTTLTTIQHRRHEGRDSQCRHVVSPRLVVNFRQENKLDCLQIIMKWKLGTFQPCYVEIHPEHSLLFSDVLRSHVTSFHAFCPNSPLQNINTLRSPQPFHSIPMSAPHSSYQTWMHYAQAIAEPSRNLSGSHGTALEVSWIHLGTFTISIIHQH